MNRYHRYLALKGELRRHAVNGLPVPKVTAKERSRRRDSAKRTHRSALLLSILGAGVLHLLVVLPLFALWFAGSPPAENTPMRVVALGPASSPRAAQRRQMPPNQNRSRTLPRKPKPPEPKVELNGQVVALPPTADPQRPKEADYLSEQDHRTDRETRSRDLAKAPRNVTKRRQLGMDVEVPVPSTTKERQAMRSDQPPGGPKGPGHARVGISGDDAHTGGASDGQVLQLPKVKRQDHLRLSFSDAGRRRNQAALERMASQYRALRIAMGNPSNRPARRGAPGMSLGNGQIGGAGARGLPSLAQLTPSLEEIQRLSGAPANDDLPEVETDAETALNAWRFKHASFFNRVKKRVSQEWEPVDAVRKNDPNFYEVRHQRRQTVLRVTIDRSGKVTDVLVRDASGARYLDDEAIRSFEAAGPFSNPPSALFGSGDRFSFNFGFAFDGSERDFDLNWRPY